MAQYKDGDSRTINGVTYVRQGGQWAPQSSAIGPTIGGNPLIPGQLAAQGPSIQGQNLQNVHTQQQIQAQPLQNENTRVNIAQGQSSIQNQRFNQLQGMRQEFNALPQVKLYSDALQALGGALQAPNTPQGDLAIVYGFAKAMDPGSVVREGEMGMANATASQTQQLQQYIASIQAGKRLPPAVRTGLVETMRQRVAAMRPAYDQQRSRYAGAASQAGFKPAEVVGEPLYSAYRPLEEQYVKNNGGTPRDPNAPGITPAQTEAGFGATENPGNLSEEQQAKDKAFLATRPSPEQYAAFLGALQGGGTVDPGLAAARLKAIQGGAAYNPLVGTDPRATQKIDQYMKQGGGPGSAAIAGFGDAASLGFMDELGAAAQSLGQPGSFADNYNVNAQANRGYLKRLRGVDKGLPYLGGNIAGGVGAGFGLAGGLSKLPALEGSLFGLTKEANPILSNVLSKEGVAGDAAFGGGYGAGSSDDNRLKGAALGAGFGLVGGAGARGGIGTAASAISPTGGKLRPLYDMGVRPSIGQRVGGVVNNLEEKLQSLPIIGDAIKGTRDRARDQFQVGLFNDSLGEIGQSLPKGMGVGHEPHAFAQDVFNKAYDAAKFNMTAVTDGAFGQDIGALQQTVGNLRPESQSQFAKLWTGSVARRMRDGVLGGSAFKDATSEIEKKIAAIRNSKTGDGELADALQQASDALKGSAMRNSPPEAVAAMDAADKGYAKLVRIEEASRKAGGEPAEFSPSQYNTAVKSTSGGTRNRQYLRGDALNADIAALGTRLGDKVSNSGTVDRYAPLAIASGMGYVEPMSAAALAGYGALNAPGVRNLVTGAMAPRANPLFDRAAEELRRRARLGGMFGAPLAIDYYGAQ